MVPIFLGHPVYVARQQYSVWHQLIKQSVSEKSV